MAASPSPQTWAYGPPPEPPRGRFRLAAVAIPTVVVVLLASVAIADGLAADGDGLVPVDNNTLSFGQVCLGTTTEAPGLVAVKRLGSYDINAFKAGSKASLVLAGVVDGGAARLRVTLSSDSIQVPDSWATAPAGSTTDPVTARVELSAEAVGSFTGSVILGAEGTNAFDRPFSRFVAMPVRAEVVECAPTNRPPKLHIPGDKEIEGNTKGGAIVEYSATADDPEDGPLVPDCAPASGEHFPLGPTRVRCRVSDSFGEEASGSFKVMVVDTIPPMLKGMPDPMLVSAQNAGGAVVRYDMPRAVDIVDPDPAVECSPASGSTFAPGTTTVTCTATDASGNSMSRSFDVTVAFRFNGFAPPVSAGGWTQVQAGSTVPIRWSIGGASGPITDPAVLDLGASGVGPCDSGGRSGSLADYATGGTGLRVAGGGFIYNFQSPDESGTCYRVWIVVADGTAYSARFPLR